MVHVFMLDIIKGFLNSQNVELILLFISLFLSLTAIYYAQRSFNTAKESLDITKDTLDVFKRDFSIRFAPMSFKLVDVERYRTEKTGEIVYVDLIIEFSNYASVPNAVDHVTVIPKDDRGKWVNFFPVNKEVIAPSETRTVRYRQENKICKKLKGLKKNLEFKDILQNPYKEWNDINFKFK